MKWLLDEIKKLDWRGGVLAALVMLLILSIIGMFLPVMPGGGTPASYIGSLTVGTLTTPIGRGATLMVAAATAPTTVKAQADYVCDGTADQVQINQAIAALPAERGGTVQLMGAFSISGKITITRRGGSDAGSGKVNLKGEGRALTCITVTPGSGDFDMIGIDGTTANIDFIQISDLYLQGDLTMSALGHGINTGGMSYGIFRNLDIRNCKLDGIHNDGTEIATGGSLQSYENVMVASCGRDGFWLVGWSGWFLKQCNTAQCYDGYKIAGVESQFLQLSADSNTHYGYYITSVTDCTFNQLWSNYNTNKGLMITNASNCLFNNVIVQGNQQTPDGDNCEMNVTTVVRNCVFTNFSVRNTGNKRGIMIYDNQNCTYSNGTITVGGAECAIYAYTAGGATRSYNNTFTALQLTATNPFGTDGIAVAIENQISGNLGYIAPGEVRTYAITLTAGVEDRTTYWQNPFAQNVWVSEITFQLITAASATAPTYDIKLDTDGAGVPDGTAFLDGVIDTAGTYWSWSNVYGTPAYGVQTAWRQLASNTSTSDWIGLCIEDAAGADSAGKFFITIVGQ